MKIYKGNIAVQKTKLLTTGNDKYWFFVPPTLRNNMKHAVGRPSKYDPKYIQAVDDYLKENVDEEVQIVKQRNDDKGYEMFENKLKVKLPTIEGFARFIDVNKTTLYEWEKDHKEFSNALDIIRQEQQQRLLNSGLSGEYNSTIAKLILSSNHGMSEKTDVTSGGEKLQGVIVLPNKDANTLETNTNTD